MVCEADGSTARVLAYRLDYANGGPVFQEGLIPLPLSAHFERFVRAISSLLAKSSGNYGSYRAERAQ